VNFKIGLGLGIKNKGAACGFDDGVRVRVRN
jgi:hypothetical protein